LLKEPAGAEPVGGVVSLILMIALAVLEFPQRSVMTYVLVTTIGQVPADVWLLVTVNDASFAHASEIDKPKPSSAATVVTGAGALATEHPTTLVSGIVPVIDGEVSSTTLMTCAAVVLFEHASVAVHVLVTTYSPAHTPGIV
jgi:hypothetical protein